MSPAPARADGEAERSWILQKESTKPSIVLATPLALSAVGTESKFGPMMVPWRILVMPINVHKEYTANAKLCKSTPYLNALVFDNQYGWPVALEL